MKLDVNKDQLTSSQIERMKFLYKKETRLLNAVKRASYMLFVLGSLFTFAYLNKSSNSYYLSRNLERIFIDQENYRKVSTL